MKDIFLALLILMVGGLLMVALPVAGGVFGTLMGGGAAAVTIWYVLKEFKEETDQ